MTRVVMTSDLHLGISTEDEILALVAAIAAERPDLTVLAGDLGEGLAENARCLALFRELPGDIGVLAGNHDLWTQEGEHSLDLWERGLPDAARHAGMTWLEEETWRRDGLAVAGSIAWYDYTGADPSVPPQSEQDWIERKRRIHPDARYINWPWSDLEFAARCGDGLVARLAALDTDPDVSGLLLVTHVPLFREQIINRPEFRSWGKNNAYFGNLTLGERVRGARKLRAVVSGHTHIGRRETLAGERAIPAWVISSDYHTPRYVVYEHPSGALREQAMAD